jgi:hypothetical protein
MRVMVIVKANQESESGALPDPEILTAMGRFNEELNKAGLLLAAEGLHSSASGKRVKYSGTSRTVVDGPFMETKELVAGFWIWKVGSMEEAVEWAKRCPNPHAGESEIEIRRVYEDEEFAELLSPELREQEARHRRDAARRK